MDRNVRVMPELIVSAIFGLIIGHITAGILLGPYSVVSIVISAPVAFAVIVIVAIVYLSVPAVVDRHHQAIGFSVPFPMALVAYLAVGALFGDYTLNIFTVAVLALAFSSSAAGVWLFYLFRFR